ncbi:MAG TPA: hypothetical protein VMF52_17920 [Steroidobacteraceae bacterium]|nr:hypothetical protein [Steroidobacteraceae bacterium]
MKDSSGTAKKLLDEVPYAPEAEAFLDEMERSGQFRIGLEAELDDDGESSSNDYAWGRGSGSVVIQDWWTKDRVVLRVNAGLAPAELVLSRIDDALVVRTADGRDRVTLEGYLGLIPDASTLSIVFDDGAELAGETLRARITTWLEPVSPA